MLQASLIYAEGATAFLRCVRDTQERAAYDSLRATTRAEVAQRGYGEEKILELHQRKRTLAGAVIEDANTLALTREDLIELLR